jgi:hypothetical protein
MATVGSAATMGLAVRIWTTVARRPARVATELVGGKGMAHESAAHVRTYVPRRFITALNSRKIEMRYV